MSRKMHILWFCRGLVLLAAILCCRATVRANEPPVADAGASRYAGTDPVELDAGGSFDPDASGTLSYAWRQVSGPTVTITDANTLSPKIGGFVQTQDVQHCEFELVVSDGELTSLPDAVEVVIVPDFGPSTLLLESGAFDVDKPTVIYFGGGYGGCLHGYAGQPWTISPEWRSKANVIDSPSGYEPDAETLEPWWTYYRYADMIIVFLSSAAPDYAQPIQTIGWSTGTLPATDVGIRMNVVYGDARYAVNRVTLIDGGNCLRQSPERLDMFLSSSVAGEQCWIDSYTGAVHDFYPAVLNVDSSLDHPGIRTWYAQSITGAAENRFNGGVVAGAYWSVVGPGKNLQLAWTPDQELYRFRWGNGVMEMADEQAFPGRLPEPVTLVGPLDAGDPAGAVLTCEESENAVAYQLLFGSSPHRITDFTIVSETPGPPDALITSLPFEETWWTVRVRDEYGSTIYADPAPIDSFVLSLPIRNVTTGTRYGSIQTAIEEALDGSEIILRQGTYREHVDFKGKSLVLRSADPNDPNVVGATVIAGNRQAPVVTFSSGETETSVLNGLTIVGGTAGIYCEDASPTITGCTIGGDGSVSIRLWYGYEPRQPNLTDCVILGQVEENDPRVAHWRLDEAEGTIARDSAGANDASLLGNPVWQPLGGIVDGAIELDGVGDALETGLDLDPSAAFSVFAWVRGGAPGQIIVSQAYGQDWLMADPTAGNLMTAVGYYASGNPMYSEALITDGQWHHVGLVWDGAGTKILYVDDVEVARETSDRGLYSSPHRRGLHIGAPKRLNFPGYWSGLIDDVRIYVRAVTP